MSIIFAVGLFRYDQFEETPNEKVVNMSKLTKPYFKSNNLKSYRAESVVVRVQKVLQFDTL